MASGADYRRIYAIKRENEKKIQAVKPDLKNESGIYFLTRADEDGINYFYIGQSVKMYDRMVSHLSGYQHIDLSLRSRGFYSKDNPYGWKLNALYYPEEKLDEMEQHWILEYTKKGYQCRYNKTAGGQGPGKKQIGEFKAKKGYRDGVQQGYKNASRDIGPLFEKYLNVSFKKEIPNKYAIIAMEKFEEFINLYK
jgi:hypothetical protein